MILEAYLDRIRKKPTDHFGNVVLLVNLDNYGKFKERRKHAN